MALKKKPPAAEKSNLPSVTKTSVTKTLIHLNKGKTKTDYANHADLQLRSRKRDIIKNLRNTLQTRSANQLNRQDYIQSLIKDGFSDKEIATQLAQQYNLQKVDFNQLAPDPKLCKKVPKKVCEKYMLIPIMQVEDSVIVAFCDPGDIAARENISMVIGLKIQPIVAERSEIKKMISKIYFDDVDSHEIQDMFTVMDHTEANEKASLGIIDLSTIQSEPVTKTVNYIIAEGVKLNASDIHVEIYEKLFRVRFRVDGCLSEKIKPPQNLAFSIINRIKVLSRMDISERRKPQDGRMKVQLNNQVIDLRVSSVPVVHGEKIVMRLLSSSMAAGAINTLGMSEKQEELFKKYIFKSQGFVLVTGPTGSGKTTTIYSGLETLNTPDKNISTAEDPVEYKLQGINQVQVNHKIHLGFADVLRTFLRQDPDIILVGEIRDLETANIAYRAAATGHLVLSTLHTNDTISTVTRLMDMGVPVYSIGENTSLIIAQRLIRLLCNSCKRQHKITESELVKIGLDPSIAKQSISKIMDKGNGCPDCNNMGYKGRKAVFEVLEMSPTLTEGIINNKPLKELKDIAVKYNNMVTLRQSALQCLLKGMTSANEVIYGTMAD